MENKVRELLAGKSEKEQLFTLSKMLVNQSVLLSRSKIAESLGKSFGGDRDVYSALGYSKTLTYNDYYARYCRQDIAKRIVNAYPNASWRLKPIIEIEEEQEETDFEKGWKDLVKQRKIFHYLLRADRISGIGTYGVLFMGFDDAKDRNAIQNPVMGAKELLFLRPYSMTNATVHTWVEEASDPRYGLPLTYNLSITDNPAGSSQNFTSNIIAHHSRILHLAEETTTNDIEGSPRLESVFNRLQDLELIVGGSSEMFWRGAFPGHAFVKDPEADIGTQALSDLEDEIQEYMHGLKRYIRLQGMSVEGLAMQIADPTGHVDVLLKIISGGTGIPVRILTGSERGELASSQDETAWSSRVDERRRDYNEPMILRPFIDRLVEFGIIPGPKNEEYAVTWPDIFTPSEKETVDIQKVVTDALVAYANSQLTGVLPLEWYLQHVLNFSEEQIQKALDMQKDMLEDEEEQIRQDEERRAEIEAEIKAEENLNQEEEESDEEDI